MMVPNSRAHPSSRWRSEIAHRQILVGAPSTATARRETHSVPLPSDARGGLSPLWCTCHAVARCRELARGGSWHVVTWAVSSWRAAALARLSRSRCSNTSCRSDATCHPPSHNHSSHNHASRTTHISRQTPSSMCMRRQLNGGHSLDRGTRSFSFQKGRCEPRFNHDPVSVAAPGSRGTTRGRRPRPSTP